MSGKKFSIGADLCPKSCDQCDAATKGGSLSEHGCADRNVKISGMSCNAVAAKGYCDYSTNIGHIGDDLCPASCGRCPARPVASSSKASSFPDPTPVRTHGLTKVPAESPAQAPESEEERNNAAAEKEDAEEKEDDKKEEEGEKKAEGGAKWRDTCNDDAVWTDADGDGCHVYGQYIKQGKLSKEEACNYGGGAAKTYCRKTCDSCADQSAAVCEDKQCVTRWRYERGKCFACSEWQNSCNLDHFANDCPRTCGLCQADAPDTTPPLPAPPKITTTVAVTEPPPPPPTKPPPCEDHECVDSWLKSFGVCHKCSDFAEDYCGRDELFMQSCRKSCRMCVEGQASCHDDFLPHTCKRYAKWGWCKEQHISDHCKASC